MTTFAALASGLRYGHQINWLLRVEGINVIFGEWGGSGWDGGAAVVAPGGYVYDHSLILDDSAKLGWIADRRTGIGRGHDLSVQLRADTTVEDLFTRPAKFAALRANVDSLHTTITVDSTTGWGATGTLYLGTERCAYTGKTATTFTGLSRGVYAKARDYVAGEVGGATVTDTPWFWRGRRVWLYASHLDATGTNYDADLLVDAAMVWTGHIDAHPSVDDQSGLWSLRCRALDRRLMQRTAGLPSGRGFVEWQTDPVMAVDPDWSCELLMESPPGDTTVTTAMTLQPFKAYSPGDVIHASQAREAFATEWAAQVAAHTFPVNFPTVGTYFAWVPEESTGNQGYLWSTWRGVARITATAANQSVRMRALIQSATMPWISNQYGTVASFLSASGTAIDFKTPFAFAQSIGAGSLRVELDAVSTADIPTTGVLLVEIDGEEHVVRYTAVKTDGSSATIWVVFDPSTGSPIEVSADAIEQGTYKDLSVQFLILDPNRHPRDEMRRLLLSSGRGDNDVTYDVLARQIGYDLDAADVDLASFDARLDGPAWSSDGLEAADWVYDRATSFAALFGELLALSGRAVCSVSSGTAVKLTVIDTSPPDTVPTDVEIGRLQLVQTGQGRHPVRVLEQFVTPNVVDIQVYSSSSKRSARILANDLGLIQLHGPTEWGVKLHGIGRETARSLGLIWSRQMFRTAEAVQVIEIDHVPWLEIQPGTVVDIELPDSTLRTLTTGAFGYTGRGRCIGWQLDPLTYRTTSTFLIDGMATTMALSPAAAVSGWSNSPAQPGAGDELHLPTAYVDVFSEWIDTARGGTNPFTVVAYRPSLDVSTTGYTIDRVREHGGFCKLRVASVVGAFTLTTAFYVTAPVSASTNAASARYMHADSTADWV